MINERKASLLEEIEYLREQEEGYIDALATAEEDDRQHFARLAMIYFRARIRAERALNEEMHA